jgi:cyclopropane fatty-acyl-phospholipid synthase-like methyltransferase
VLQSVGRGSSALAGVIAAAAAELGDLQQRLRTPGAAILDVGSGTGWLAMALAETYPEAHVVGIDVWQPAIALARRNVVAARLEERVELRQQDATRLADTDSYDLVWIACPFLPEHVLLRAAEKARAALRPGGWMVLGIFAGPDDPLATRLSDLRTIRSGGHPWTTEELVALATAAGLADAHEVARTWNTPARLVVARRD